MGVRINLVGIEICMSIQAEGLGILRQIFYAAEIGK